MDEIRQAEDYVSPWMATVLARCLQAEVRLECHDYDFSAAVFTQPDPRLAWEQDWNAEWTGAAGHGDAGCYAFSESRVVDDEQATSTFRYLSGEVCDDCYWQGVQVEEVALSASRYTIEAAAFQPEWAVPTETAPRADAVAPSLAEDVGHTLQRLLRMPESWSETCCTAHFPGDVHYTRGSRLQLSRPALPLRVCFEDQVVISWANLWRRQTNTFLRSCVVQHRLAALTASVPGCPFNLPADCSSESACNRPVDARSQLVPSHGTSTACLLPPARGLCAGADAEHPVARQPVMSILCAAASLPCCPPTSAEVSCILDPARSSASLSSVAPQATQAQSQLVPPHWASTAYSLASFANPPFWPEVPSDDAGPGCAPAGDAMASRTMRSTAGFSDVQLLVASQVEVSPDWLRGPLLNAPVEALTRLAPVEPALASERRYTIFEKNVDTLVRRCLPGWSVLDFIASAISHVPYHVRSAAFLEQPIEGYPTPQVVLTAASLPRPARAIPIDLRPMAGLVHTIAVDCPSSTVAVWETLRRRAAFVRCRGLLTMRLLPCLTRLGPLRRALQHMTLIRSG